MIMARKFSNQYRRSRNSYPSRGGILSNRQKANICILSREAFEKQKHSWISIELSEWRRHQQFLAVGKDSLRDCVQGDYLKLVAHFQNLKGEPGRALKTHMRDAVQEKRIALRKLETECGLRGLDTGYPAKICRNKFKCGLDDATPRQLWCLFFDVRTSKHRTLDRINKIHKMVPDQKHSDHSVHSVEKADFPF
jgi:hypothetical protein